jgi:hypothetical protein
MQFGQRNAELARDAQRDRRQNRMPLSEEEVQRFTQAIVRDLFDRNVPENIGSAFASPTGDVDQCHGTIQPRRREQAQHRAVVVLGLRIGGQVLIDNLRHAHPF